MADWLYEQIFGSNDDWTVTSDNNRAYYRKIGRSIELCGYDYRGSSMFWANLTGSEHRLITGASAVVSANIVNGNGYNDFIKIPKIITDQMQKTTPAMLGLDFVIEANRVSTQDNTRSVQLYYMLRKKINEDEE